MKALGIDSKNQINIQIYQLLFVTPGISPLLANSRKQILQIS
jgi:hypothetical protein